MWFNSRARVKRRILMSIQTFPVVGNWYQSLDGQLLEVITLDEDENSVEVQYFGGEIDQVEFDTWQSIIADIADQPDDWTGPYDELEPEALGYSDTGYSSRFASFSIDELE